MSSIMSVDYFAKRVAVEKSMLENNGAVPVVIDPATIALIISISVKLIKCLYKRYGKDPEKIQENIQTPGFLDTIGLRRVVFATLGWRRYRKEGATVMEALIKTGGKLKLEDIQMLITKGL